MQILDGLVVVVEAVQVKFGYGVEHLRLHLPVSTSSNQHCSKLQLRHTVASGNLHVARAN
jgi:hypothetical protein